MANTNSSNPTDYRGYTAIAIGCTVGLAVAIAGIADSLGFIDLNPTEERAQSQEVSLSPITGNTIWGTITGIVPYSTMYPCTKQMPGFEVASKGSLGMIIESGYTIDGINEPTMQRWVRPDGTITDLLNSN